MSSPEVPVAATRWTRAANAHAGGAGAHAALGLARKQFLASERIDIQRLTAELGVDRSTLFRWVGNRDQLIVSVLMSFIDPMIDAAADEAPGTGGARIARVMGIYARRLIEHEGYRDFLRRESDRALRLTTTRASPVQQYVVARFEQLLERERDRGHLTHSMETHDLAYLIVRIAESFIYADLITDDTPDAARVEAAVAALLHADLSA